MGGRARDDRRPDIILSCSLGRAFSPVGLNVSIPFESSIDCRASAPVGPSALWGAITTSPSDAV